jgi:hypothetical protein
MAKSAMHRYLIRGDPADAFPGLYSSRGQHFTPPHLGTGSIGYRRTYLHGLKHPVRVARIRNAIHNPWDKDDSKDA